MHKRDETITKKKVIKLAKKYKLVSGNPDVKKITEELVKFPMPRHYKRVRQLIPIDMIVAWETVVLES